MSCPKCIQVRSNAKAEGFRSVRQFVCYDCAAVDIDEAFARLGYVPDEDNIRKAARQMGVPYVAPAAPGQQMELAL